MTRVAPARRSARARPRREAGFSLLEVIVAFAILSVCLAALLRVFGDSAARAEDAAVERRATLVAESLLAGVGRETPLGPGETRGERDGLAWRVRVAAADRTNARVPLTVYDATVTVGGVGDSARAVSLHTLRLGPGP